MSVEAVFSKLVYLNEIIGFIIFYIALFFYTMLYLQFELLWTCLLRNTISVLSSNSTKIFLASSLCKELHYLAAATAIPSARLVILYKALNIFWNKNNYKYKLNVCIA